MKSEAYLTKRLVKSVSCDWWARNFLPYHVHPVWISQILYVIPSQFLLPSPRVFSGKLFLYISLRIGKTGSTTYFKVIWITSTNITPSAKLLCQFHLHSAQGVSGFSHLIITEHPKDHSLCISEQIFQQLQVITRTLHRSHLYVLVTLYIKKKLSPALSQQKERVCTPALISAVTSCHYICHSCHIRWHSINSVLSLAI